MHRAYIHSFFILFLCSGALAQKKAAINFTVDIRIPSTWIEKVRRYKYRENNAAILKDFDRLIKPRSIFIPDFNKDLDKNKSGLLNPIFADLDGEAGDELICTLAWDESYPSMAVFKKIGAIWHLLYFEDYYMFYSAPDMHIANNFSRNKTFYFRTVYERGSGVYSDGYKFYKLINNKVYPCLETVHEAHITGWGLYITQEVSSDLRFDASKDELITLSYNYTFEGASPGSSNEYIELIKGTGAVSYWWDEKSKKYVMDIPTYKSYDGLTAAQIACFGNFDNDVLFIRAFNKQINNTLKTGTAQQIRSLKKYLAQVSKQKSKVKEQ